MAAMLREHVASDAALTLPAPDDSAPSPTNDDIGLVVWGSLRTAADAAWGQVEAFKDHPRQLEFGVRVCDEMLRGKQNAQTAATVRALLDTLLAAAKEATRQKTRAEASSRPATADAGADAKGGKDKGKPAKGAPAAEPEVELNEEDQAKEEGATRLQKLLRTQHMLLQSIRKARAATKVQLPWRAQARLLLAICTALMPPPPPAEVEEVVPPEAEEPAAAEGEGESGRWS